MQLDSDTLRYILDNLYDGLYLLDKQKKISYWNRGAERITGFRSDDVDGKPCSSVLMHVDARGRKLCSDMCTATGTLQDEKTRESVLYILHRDGHRIPVATRVIPSRDAEGDIMGVAVIFSDVISKVVHIQRLEELQKMLHSDPMSDLQNKRYVEINLHLRFDEMHRYDRSFGAFFMDVHNLQEINEKHGYDVGNKVLRMVAMTLLNTVRSADVLSRWGKNRFVAIVADVDSDQLYHIAQRASLLVEQSLLTDEDISIRAEVSIGVSLAQPKDNVYLLLKRVEELAGKSRIEGAGVISIDAEV